VQLLPRAAELGGLAFEIDENSHGQAAARDPAAWIAPGVDRFADPELLTPEAPRSIALRIVELRVADGTEFASGGLRLGRHPSDIPPTAATASTASRSHCSSIR
jgi:hypothetical protein